MGMFDFWCTVSMWRWDIIAAVSGVVNTIATLVILYYLSTFEQLRKRHRLSLPGSVCFVIRSSAHHVCEYAVQNELEHRVQTVILKPNAEVIVDLALFPNVEFDATETAFGCDGDVSKKPYAFEYYNRFIKSGNRRHVIPGKNRYEDYVDKHHYYHAVENSHFNKGNVKAMGFKIKTLSEGVYNGKIFFVGSTVRGEFSGLTIIVSDNSIEAIHCVDPDHAHRNCAVRIRSSRTG